MSTKLIFGSGRFASAVTNNRNGIFVGKYDVPTKLVDMSKDVLLCLPAQVEEWGNYPTHQESWLSLPFVVACHSRHMDEDGLAVRQTAWDNIPAVQWPALAEKAAQFATEFRQRLAEGDVSDKKKYKSLTRALQDCVLYLVERKFPKDQDVVLSASPVRSLIEKANAGRQGELSDSEGLALADEVDALVGQLVSKYGGRNACREALVELMASSGSPGRVVLLLEDVTLDRGAEMVSYDIVLGQPDAHDIDVVSVVSGAEPYLVQMKNELSGQRMDIVVVPEKLGPKDELTGGHPPFQSVAEMLLANGCPVTDAGRRLTERLAGEVCPAELAQKYREVAKDFLFNATNPKSWVVRRDNPETLQVKKAIPLYRVACDLLPRAFYMECEGRFPGGENLAVLAENAGIGKEYRQVTSFLERQDASQEKLEEVATSLAKKI